MPVPSDGHPSKPVKRDVIPLLRSMCVCVPTGGREEPQAVTPGTQTTSLR